MGVGFAMLPRNQMQLPIPRLYLSLRQSLTTPRLTPAQLQRAEAHYRKVYSTCPHAPKCGTHRDCVRSLALEMRERGYL